MNRVPHPPRRIPRPEHWPLPQPPKYQPPINPRRLLSGFFILGLLIMGLFIVLIGLLEMPLPFGIANPASNNAQFQPLPTATAAPTATKLPTPTATPQPQPTATAPAVSVPSEQPNAACPHHATALQANATNSNGFENFSATFQVDCAGQVTVGWMLYNSNNQLAYQHLQTNVVCPVAGSCVRQSSIPLSALPHGGFRLAVGVWGRDHNPLLIYTADAEHVTL